MTYFCYRLLKKLLFRFNPETAHTLSLKLLSIAYQMGCIRPGTIQGPACSLMGLSFPNPVGLAAGYDKNAEYVDALSCLGFGFIEVGTVTPKPQFGNPRPRLFRLETDQAVINRMGFNNKGADYVAAQLAQSHYRGILGINIGKNRDTPLEHAIEDYLYCFRVLWPYASYLTINISSPNTAHLRDLQQSELLTALLSALKKEQADIKLTHHKYVPLVVKIAPDLSLEEIEQLAAIFLAQQIDGVIATNTTISRNHLQTTQHAQETGGLSGQPLFASSTQILAALAKHLHQQIPLIASGGVMEQHHATQKFASGASLVQVYTGLIYHGPRLIHDCCEARKN